MNLQPLRLYQKKDTQEVYRLITIGRDTSSGSYFAVFQDVDRMDWIKPLSEFKDTFEELVEYDNS